MVVQIGLQFHWAGWKLQNERGWIDAVWKTSNGYFRFRFFLGPFAIFANGSTPI